MIIDTPDNAAPQIIHLQADKVDTVIRYLTTNTTSDKLVTPAEAKALGAAGIRLGLVFEVYGGSNGHDDINEANGLIDAKFCLEYVRELGIPSSEKICVFFAIDHDASAGNIRDCVLPYFKAIHETFDGEMLVGVYGSGAVCATTYLTGYVEYTWLAGSTKWTNSHEYLTSKPKELVLVQDTMDIHLANLDVDTNYALGPFGDFLPFGDATILPKVATVVKSIGKPHLTQSDLHAGVSTLVAYLKETLGWEAAFVPTSAEETAVQDVVNAADNTTDLSPASRQAAGQAALRTAINAAGYGRFVSDLQCAKATTTILAAVAANRAALA